MSDENAKNARRRAAEYHYAASYMTGNRVAWVETGAVKQCGKAYCECCPDRVDKDCIDLAALLLAQRAPLDARIAELEAVAIERDAAVERAEAVTAAWAERAAEARGEVWPAHRETQREARLTAQLALVSGALCDAGTVTVEPYHEAIRALTRERDEARASAACPDRSPRRGAGEDGVSAVMLRCVAYATTVDGRPMTSEPPGAPWREARSPGPVVGQFLAFPFVVDWAWLARPRCNCGTRFGDHLHDCPMATARPPSGPKEE